MASHKRGGSDSLPLPLAKKSLPNTSHPVKQHQEGASWKDLVVEKMGRDLVAQHYGKCFNSLQEDEQIDGIVFIIQRVMYHSGEKLDRTYVHHEKIIETLQNDDTFRHLLYEAIPKQDWCSILDSPILQLPIMGRGQPDIPKLEKEDKIAVAHAWEHDYIGDMAQNLKATILGCQWVYYARYTSIIQSSGTGKSRMIDELAKTTLVIPICFAKPDSDSYPPSDTEAYRWASETFQQATTQTECFSAAQNFLQALFDVTRKRLEDIDKSGILEGSEDRATEVAGEFRTRMTEGMTFSQHNKYRVEFYEEVLELAEKYGSPQTTSSSAISPGNEPGVFHAAKKLWETLKAISHRTGFVVIAFDESHSLAETSRVEHEWSLLSEIQDALLEFHGLPIFSIFLSTSSKMHPPSSSFVHPFGRTLEQFRPIVGTAFDLFARSRMYSEEGKWELESVASTEHIVRLGRPLFYTMYAAGSDLYRKSLISFVRRKLLFSTSEFPNTPDQELACLAVRLGLEFQTTSRREQDVERRQVERHMRICLSLSSDFERMVSISPSEPFLAEAAYTAMTHPESRKKSWTDVLLFHMDHSYLDPGTRGGIAAALILLLARDNAVNPTKTSLPFDKNGMSSGRIVSLSRFLDMLFRDKFVKPAAWMDRLPSVSDKKDGEKMGLAFEGCYVYFNHFVQAHAFDLVSREYLPLAVFRGAAIICTTNQKGFDIVIPYVKGNILKKEAVGAILIQVKNSSDYTDSISTALFDAMDPFDCGIYGDNDRGNALPVIRMVFALASQKDAIMFKSPERTSLPSRTSPAAKFTAYDIWCAGVGIFGCIQEQDIESAYRLVRLPGAGDSDRLDKEPGTSEEPHRLPVKAIRSMHPYSTTHPDRFRGWVKMDE